MSPDLRERDLTLARHDLTAVLFDFGGTLDADGVPWSAQFHRAYRALGGAADEDTFAAAFRASDVRLGSHASIATLGFRAMLDLQTTLLAPLLPDGARVDHTAVVAAVHDAARRTAARNRDVLATLRGLRLGVVSNFTGNLERCLDELGLRTPFDVVLDSTVVGMAKPEPAIFREALSRLGASASRTLMVGDNPFADVRAAAACGLCTCWLAPAERRAPDGVRFDVRIARLDELPAALGTSAVPNDLPNDLPDDLPDAACSA